MKDYQPSSSTSPTSPTPVSVMDSMPRIQRIRNIPIERIPSPNNSNHSNNSNNISENNIPPIPKKLNQEDRFRIHSNQVERKIVPGAAFLPKIQHHPNHQHHRSGISSSNTLADHQHHRRFDGGGFRENHHQYPVNSHSFSHHPQHSHQQQPQQHHYNLRTTPFGESLRHRTISPAGSYSSYEHQQQPSAAGIQLVAQYGVAQDTGHSTASTPSASRPKFFPGSTNRGGSLPTSHSINLPSHSYNNYRIQMPSRLNQHSPNPHRHHPNHQHHIHDSEDVLPEIEASGLPQDPIIEAERQEPDYHLVESGSDILLSTKEDVPAPAPTSTTGPTVASRSTRTIPETDILDSSCSSDDDDDVVKNCDVEDAGNARGMNRRF